MHLSRFTRSFCLAVTLALPAVATPAEDPQGPAKPGLVVQDVFGRTVNEKGLTLVDWEGYVANPAIKFYLVPPASAAFPATAVLTADEPRLHFDLPSTTSASGPRKEVVWKKPEKIPVYVSIFPDRDGDDEEHQLKIDFTDASGNRVRLAVPVHVIDQDRDRGEAFRVSVDFTRDKTGFFDDEKARAVVRQAATDWAYFFADMNLRPVPAGDETTPIWGPDGFKTLTRVTNAREYTGYLLYAYGIRTEPSAAELARQPFWHSLLRNPPAREIRSGGEPSAAGGFQVAAGQRLPLRRSGGLEVEIRGNYNTLGWQVTLADRDWWQVTNFANVSPDLYSIVHHEIGHALVFNPNNTRVKRGAVLEDERVRAYLGRQTGLDRSDHLSGVVDPESLHGAFGNEYHGRMPPGRWLITKTDLLCAQAIGYQLRDTSLFAPLRIADGDLPAGQVGALYKARLRAIGGIPFYCWDAVDPLPTGLSLNSFTGELSGKPGCAGVFEPTVRVRDYTEAGNGVTKRLRIELKDKP